MTLFELFQKKFKIEMHYFGANQHRGFHPITKTRQAISGKELVFLFFNYYQNKTIKRHQKNEKENLSKECKMNIDWKLIKEKYPKSYEKFIDCIFFKPFKIAKIQSDLDYLIIKDNLIILGAYKISFCFCDLEKFFDEQGIIILYKHRIGHFQIEIRNKNISLLWCSPLTETRQEAQEQAIYKAFEIMENKL